MNSRGTKEAWEGEKESRHSTRQVQEGPERRFGVHREGAQQDHPEGPRGAWTCRPGAGQALGMGAVSYMQCCQDPPPQ